jgi:hypothetical protein
MRINKARKYHFISRLNLTTLTITLISRYSTTKLGNLHSIFTVTHLHYGNAKSKEQEVHSQRCHITHPADYPSRVASTGARGILSTRTHPNAAHASPTDASASLTVSAAIQLAPSSTRPTVTMAPAHIPEI